MAVVAAPFSVSAKMTAAGGLAAGLRAAPLPPYVVLGGQWGNKGSGANGSEEPRAQDLGDGDHICLWSLRGGTTVNL